MNTEAGTAANDAAGPPQEHRKMAIDGREQHGQGVNLFGVSRAYEVVQRMVGQEGCAWHGVQTHESLTRYLIEETYELVDAIEQGTQSHVAEELGDVLYQVLFHAALAARDAEGYDLNTVGEALADKLIARHPHVFSDRGYMSVEELNAEWEHLKEAADGEAHGSRHPLEGIPREMASLAKAAKVVERLRRAGVLHMETTPHDTSPAASSVQHQVSNESPVDRVSEEALGDAILSLVVIANHAGIDADRALRLATARFAEAHLDGPGAERGR